MTASLALRIRIWANVSALAFDNNPRPVVFGPMAAITYRSNMAIDEPNCRYRHDIEQWTVGQLRHALSGLSDDTVLRVEVAQARRFHPPDGSGGG
ncbi:DUF6225 family protein [Dactylosporangium sucinum]|uniref:DUF6225 family protein n=1 Tax=Dactylosporangium sucinum TaxID=1424081 RepID=UPI00167E5E72|nr:DUF6225 family protein [Dactylosporangium sucinum]